MRVGSPCPSQPSLWPRLGRNFRTVLHMTQPPFTERAWKGKSPSRKAGEPVRRSAPQGVEEEGPPLRNRRGQIIGKRLCRSGTAQDPLGDLFSRLSAEEGEDLPPGILRGGGNKTDTPLTALSLSLFRSLICVYCYPSRTSEGGEEVSGVENTRPDYIPSPPYGTPVATGAVEIYGERLF